MRLDQGPSSDGSLRLAEIGIIVDDLVSRYGKELEPAQVGEAHWRYRYWLHYAEGSLMPPLLLKLVVNRLGLFGWVARGFRR